MPRSSASPWRTWPSSRTRGGSARASPTSATANSEWIGRGAPADRTCKATFGSIYKDNVWLAISWFNHLWWHPTKMHEYQLFFSKTLRRVVSSYPEIHMNTRIVNLDIRHRQSWDESVKHRKWIDLAGRQTGLSKPIGKENGNVMQIDGWKQILWM